MNLNGEIEKLRLNWPKRPGGSDSKDINAKKSKSLICSNEIHFFYKINLSGNIASGYFPAEPTEAGGMELRFGRLAFFNAQRLNLQKYSESL
jgi:hypothetical protein